jgi:hypothetical protein
MIFGKIEEAQQKTDTVHLATEVRQVSG